MRNSQASEDTTPRQAMDDSLTEYKGALYNDIRVIGLKVRLYQLIYSWFKYRCKNLLTWFRNLWKHKSVVRPKKLMVENYENFAEKYKNMKTQNKNLKMRDFCAIVNISFDEFNRYYSKYCQNN